MLCRAKQILGARLPGILHFVWKCPTFGVTWWHSWLRHCHTSWKVAGSISDGVTGILR